MGVKTPFLLLDYLIGSCLSAAATCFPRGGCLSRFVWRLQGLKLPSIPVGVRWPSLQGLFGDREDGVFDIHLMGVENPLYFVISNAILCGFGRHALALLLIISKINRV
ncbi:hypothetical protein ASG66_15240 [Bacillus sp. Leaf406]|nr:hypothetical protein ASG66_15240 [Bacillus sp. Leaf406]